MNSSSSEEWVEKVPTVKSDRNANDTNQERDEWMNMPTSFYTSSTIDKKVEREKKKQLTKEQDRYNPKQNIRELNPYWKDGGNGLPNFIKPTDNEFVYKKNSTSSNWRKRTTEVSKDNFIQKEDEKSDKLPEAIVNQVSQKDLNVLAAKLVKAELLGSSDLIKELKYKLDQARKQLEQPSNQVETAVMLTTSDSHGTSRPFKTASNYGETSGVSRKKQRVGTHVNNERVRYFADDDKYSLKQMFEHEKFNNIDEQNKEFLKIVTKSKTDLDDFFTDEIRKTESDVKSNKKSLDRAINAHNKVSKRLDNCKYCLQSDVMSKHLMVSMGETMYLSIPPFEPITEGHSFIIPLRHVSCAVQLDENEWSELLTFRRSICNMFNSIEKDVIFFETALYFYKHPHMVLHCVPVSKEHGQDAPIYFKKAIDESEVEWSMNKKLVSLSGRDVRKAVPKGLPYFSVSFGMTEGYAHVIEDEKIFPQNFAQEIIGGMLDLDHSKWRKPQKRNFEQQSIEVQNFAKLWFNFDCTK